MKKLIVTTALLALILSCCNRNTASNRTSAAITGTLFIPGGTTPAAGATVKLFDTLPSGLEPLSITITGADGGFSFENLDSGMYRVWAEKDSFVLFVDSIGVTSEAVPLGGDTLEVPSSLTGIVAMEPRHEPTSVTISPMGTGKSFSVPGNDGRFTLTGLAGGTAYLLLESLIPEYRPTIIPVRLGHGSRDTLGDTLRLAFAGIPVVNDVALSMDTLAGAVRISWSSTACRDVKDYVVYKDPCDALTLLPEPVFATKDTFLTDPGWSGDVATPADTMGHCWNYRVAVRTISGATGSTNGFSRLPVVPKYFATTFFDNRITCEGRWFDSISINDTVLFAVTAKNRTRPLRSLAWLDHSTGTTINGVVSGDSTRRELTDSLRISFPTKGVHYFYALVTDNSGKTWADEMAVRVVIDTLAAEAGNDTGVFIDEKVALHGSAFHKFGTIPAWRWKIGTNEWMTSTSPDTVFSPPAAEQTVLCSLSITDDDGKSSIDTVKFTTSFKAGRVAAGGYHSLILKSDGGLWTCGDNLSGQLGDGTNQNRPVPARIMSGVKSMAAGDLHTLILTSTGTLLACGDNSRGQFGDGTTEGCLLPKTIMSDVQSIAAGGTFSLILKTDGSLRVCGWNSPTVPADSVANFDFLPVNMMNDVRSMAAGAHHILILKNDNTLWTCGSNTFGQLGDGSMADRFTPLQVMADVASVSAGAAHSMLVKIDGSVWACGNNMDGQLGNGSRSSSAIWKRVSADDVSVSAGANFSLMVKSDGSLLACGNNSAGQHGNGTHSTKSTPAWIMDNVQQVAAGAAHSLILKTDGTVWICGANESGQLGIGWLSNSGPVRVVPYFKYN